MDPGERMLIACNGGGPSASRLVHYPPPIEVPEIGGLYVLVDDGDEHDWYYQWVPDER